MWSSPFGHNISGCIVALYCHTAQLVIIPVGDFNGVVPLPGTRKVARESCGFRNRALFPVMLPGCECWILTGDTSGSDTTTTGSNGTTDSGDATTSTKVVSRAASDTTEARDAHK